MNPQRLVQRAGESYLSFEYRFNPPSGLWRLLGVKATLVTDANVANRYLEIVWRNGDGTIVFANPSLTPQAASNTRTYAFSNVGTGHTSLPASVVSVPMSPDIYCENGKFVTLRVVSPQATDSVSDTGAIWLKIE